MVPTLTRHELLALVTYAICNADKRQDFAARNPASLYALIDRDLIHAPTGAVLTPEPTMRGCALLDFMCHLPLPEAKTTWTLPGIDL
jgi:hypothetical protein